MKMGIQFSHILCYNLHQNCHLHTLSKPNIKATSTNGVSRTTRSKELGLKNTQAVFASKEKKGKITANGVLRAEFFR